jgi:hypothetical protein
MGVQRDSTSGILRFKKAYDSVWKEVLYNTLIKFGELTKLIRLIKMCLNFIYSKVHICKHLSDSFPMQNGSPLLFNFALVYAIGNVLENQ